jgi:secernin
MPCDTAVLCTRGSVYFLKNSDRHPNEEQIVCCYGSRPGTANGGPEMVQATYISVRNSVEDSLPVVLSRPKHMFGAEMGCNSAGVVIGNEAIFSTVVPVSTEPRHLTGMDLVRLSLERGRTAADAVRVLTRLLEAHGQGGNCGFQDNFMVYHNGFIVADSEQRFIVLAVGSEWAVLDRTDRAVVALSNTIPRDILFGDITDASSGFRRLGGSAQGIHDALVAAKWGYPALQDKFANGACRQCDLGAALEKVIADPAAVSTEASLVSALFSCLRLHQRGLESGGPAFSAAAVSDCSLSHVSVCMHAGWGPIRVCHTTASLVVRIGPSLASSPSTFEGSCADPLLSLDVWSPLTSTPCMSFFKPVRFAPHDDFAQEPSLWWRHERLMRMLTLLPTSLSLKYCLRLREFEARIVQEFYPVGSADSCRRKPSIENVSLQCEQWATKMIDDESRAVKPGPVMLLSVILSSVVNPLRALLAVRIAQLHIYGSRERLSRWQTTAGLLLPAGLAGLIAAITMKILKASH